MQKSLGMDFGCNTRTKSCYSEEIQQVLGKVRKDLKLEKKKEMGIVYQFALNSTNTVKLEPF